MPNLYFGKTGMSVFELKADIRRRLKALHAELDNLQSVDPQLVLVYRPDSTNAGVTDAGVFMANYVGDDLWKTYDYSIAEARIQKYNLRYTSVVEYREYLGNCIVNLEEIRENL